MFHKRRVSLRTSLLLLLVLVLPLGVGGLPSAAVGDEVGVTVVRELTERRTEYASTYLLSNGQLRTVFSQAPVNYKDADGAWQPVDTALVANPDGSWRTKAVAVPVTFRASAAKVTQEG